MTDAPSTSRPGVVTDRRQRRWLATHETLYTAAAELFLDKGFNVTTIDDIAERADVARKTAFNHFARKRDFIGEWGRRRRAVAERHVTEDDGAIETMKKYLTGLAQAHESDRTLTRRMLDGWRECGGPFDGDEHKLVSVFAELVERGISEGALRPDVDSPRLATVLYSSYFGVLFDWGEGSDSDAPFELSETLLDVLDIVLHGAAA